MGIGRKATDQRTPVDNIWLRHCSGLSARVPECPKIKKGGLDQYDAERFGGLILPQSEKLWD